MWSLLESTVILRVAGSILVAMPEHVVAVRSASIEQAQKALWCMLVGAGRGLGA